jgi:hypothetical protein
MLSSVSHSPRAVEVNIAIMRTFVVDPLLAYQSGVPLVAASPFAFHV